MIRKEKGLNFENSVSIILGQNSEEPPRMYEHQPVMSVDEAKKYTEAERSLWRSIFSGPLVRVKTEAKNIKSK